MDEQKRKRGGQPKPPEQKLEQRSIRMKPAHWEEWELLGGNEWQRRTMEASAKKRARAAAKKAPKAG